MLKQLEVLYSSKANKVYKQIMELINTYQKKYKPIDSVGLNLTEKDSILITYGDSIIKKDEKPLVTLGNFLRDEVKNVIGGVHILPFYPFTSDDGFSVVDYNKVNPEFGEWKDIESLGSDYDLMFDAVINHISQKSEWYEKFKAGDEAYKDFFILCDPNEDYSLVTRPRALPLLTPVRLNGKDNFVWTTFSEDQIDLNYENPKVLLKILEVLFEYILHGAKFIRLDAIGFAWKKIGTSCIHLPETHALIQIIRIALTEVREDVVIVTETNVPHHENISYFGDGFNEAHMVYQFPLPPLTLYTLLSADATKLLKWADSLGETSGETTYFNFLASHDGIGLRPVEEILSNDERQLLVDTVILNGGLVSYKDNGDGTKSPYELNVNYMDALGVNVEEEDILVKKIMAASAIHYSMVGVPGIYIHSLFGSSNDLKGVEVSGINRRINREKLEADTLKTELIRDARRHGVFEGNKELLLARQSEKAFNPFGKQVVEQVDSRLFTLRRYSLDESECIYVVINVSNESVLTKLNGIDVLTQKSYKGETSIAPYEILWIKE